MDARQYAPATQRNRQPILKVLQKINLPTTGDILELASGTGEHAVFFAPHFAPRTWIPSDPNPLARDSIMAWQEQSNIANLAQPLDLNAIDTPWLVEESNLDIAAIININMIHISSWDTCLGLMTGAKRILPIGGILYLYGPYKRNGQHTAISNANFDRSLRDRNPLWGVRNLEDVMEVAQQNQLKLQNIVEMPANNLSLIFVKSS